MRSSATAAPLKPPNSAAGRNSPAEPLPARVKDEHREGYRRSERLFGTFYRRFALPADADAEHTSATCTNGVLEVVIPKEEAVKPRCIEVRG